MDFTLNSPLQLKKLEKIDGNTPIISNCITKSRLELIEVTSECYCRHSPVALATPFVQSSNCKMIEWCVDPIDFELRCDLIRGLPRVR